VTISVVIAGGGTGGHVAPGLAIADALGRREPAARISFIGTRRGIEGSAVTAAGYPLHLIDVIPWARTLGAKRYLAPMTLIGATVRCRSILRRERASVVVSVGGYASLPAVVASRLGRVPTLVHEQNAEFGVANLIEARLTPHVALGFERAVRQLGRRARPRVTGVPLRRAITTVDRSALRDEALRAFDLRPGAATLLVLGGSLGASRLNAAAVSLARRWRGRDERQILLVAGPANIDEVRSIVDHDAGLPLRSVGFVERVELAYAAADLAVARSGASVVSELAAVGLPSVLVPYPYARRGHQEANARALERAGGAVVVPERDASDETLAAHVERLLEDREELGTMSARARAFGKPDAADAIAEWALALAAGKEVASV
jgi:UDP-N-acetylglucosamine--N-acetylmuramyl-(pentapeptide) pyrophosphoryl-undecaprenol N-acetylglucosamine transferase